MFYKTADNRHGLRHDPWKALVVPRPIGWISTISADGIANLAPYSFFNAVSDRPHYIVFGSSGAKDTVTNIEQTGSFVCNLATWDLREQMNLSSAAVGSSVSEFELTGLTPVSGTLVPAPRVAEAAAALECVHHRTVELPAVDAHGPGYTVVFGQVVGIHIADTALRDGAVDVGALRPVARLAGSEYAVVTPETVFSMTRPATAADGRTIVGLS